MKASVGKTGIASISAVAEIGSLHVGPITTTQNDGFIRGYKIKELIKRWWNRGVGVRAATIEVILTDLRADGKKELLQGNKQMGHTAADVGSGSRNDDMMPRQFRK